MPLDQSPYLGVQLVEDRRCQVAATSRQGSIVREDGSVPDLADPRLPATQPEAAALSAEVDPCS